KKDYFFGAHDDNRVQFTVGRDIRLDPPQQGAPLNYFIYPYGELDGKPLTLASQFTFHDRMNAAGRDRKSTRLNSSHRTISYAVFCLKKKKKKKTIHYHDHNYDTYKLLVISPYY